MQESVTAGENNSGGTLGEHSGKIPGLRGPLENRILVPALHPRCCLEQVFPAPSGPWFPG